MRWGAEDVASYAPPASLFLTIKLCTQLSAEQSEASSTSMQCRCLAISCFSCLQAEVTGPDCSNAWSSPEQACCSREHVHRCRPGRS